MTKLFWGFLVAFLNLNLTLGDTAVLSLLPGWLGYLLIVWGAAELAHESECFVRLRPIAIAAAVYTGVIWVMDATGLSASLDRISTLLGFIGLILSLLVSYRVVCGILDMETRWGDLGGGVLKRRWEVMAVMECLSYLTAVIPLLALIFTLAALAFTVLFLVSVYKAGRVYAARKSQPPL